ncbi:MAG: hypothetical protein PHX70_05180, partial [Clostridium sp.]|nr:hypothetical protein [Clostridium sp.]
MDNYSNKFEPGNINKVNLMILWAVCIVLSIENLVLYGTAKIDVVIVLTISGIIGTIFYFLPIKKIIRGACICLVPIYASFYLLYSLKADPKFFIVYLGGVAMATLYINDKLLMIYAGIFIVSIIIYEILEPTYLMGTTQFNSLLQFIQRLFVIDAVISILY